MQSFATTISNQRTAHRSTKWCARILCPCIKKAKGFVRYYWLDTGKGEGASVSVFQDKAGADESIQLAADYTKNHMSKLITMKPEVVEGPVKAHD